MLEIVNILDKINNEEELLEKLVQLVNANKMDEARSIAALIQAGRDIRFDLRKILDADNTR